MEAWKVTMISSMLPSFFFLQTLYPSTDPSSPTG